MRKLLLLAIIGVIMLWTGTAQAGLCPQSDELYIAARCCALKTSSQKKFNQCGEEAYTGGTWPTNISDDCRSCVRNCTGFDKDFCCRSLCRDKGCQFCK